MMRDPPVKLGDRSVPAAAAVGHPTAWRARESQPDVMRLRLL